MKALRQKKIFNVGFRLALVILVGIGLLSYQRITKLIETANRAKHTHEVIESFYEILCILKDAESGQRGYIITGEERFLEDYYTPIEAIAQEIKNLRTLTADNPSLQRRLDTLELLVNEKLAWMKEKIDLRKNKGFEPARQMTLTGRGKELTENIRKLTAEMENEQKELMRHQDEESKAEAKNTILASLLGTFLSFGLLVLVFYFLNREIDQRKHAEEMLQRACDGLEARVQEGTAKLLKANQVLRAEIAERKRAEEALRANEEKYRRIIEDTLDVIYTLSLDGTISFVSPRVSSLGYSPEEIVGRNMVEVIHPDDVTHVLNDLQRTIQTGEQFPTVFRLRRKDGSYVWVEEFGKAVREGDKVVHFTGVIRDITERKRMEEEVSKLRKAVETSGEAIFLTDREGIITYINPEFTRLYGFSAAEVVGKVTPRILKSGKMKPEDYEIFWKTILSKQVVKGELINKTKDGRFLNIEGSANPILDEQGNIIGFLAIQRDITDRARQEAQCKRLEEQFLHSQKMEAIGQLAGGVAHDFNNLLTAIKGYAGFAKDALPPKDPIREDIEEVLNAAERAANLTRQLLAFSRRQVINPQVINLNELVLNVDKMLRRLIGEDIELVTIPQEDLSLVKVDPGQMEQVIVNLAINARDAMPDGGKLIIETKNVYLDEEYVRRHLDTTPGDYIMLTISDTGSGMSEEVKAHLFEPFFTTKETGKGSGLGLATVYGIIKQHQGDIFVYSEAGKGTTVKVYLSRVEEKEKGLSSRGKAEHLPNGNEAVLVVEDEPSVRNLTVRILSKLGYTVLEASNGEEALQVGKKHDREIRLLLTDVVMPKMSGKELADQFKMTHPGIKVLFVSGYTEDIIAHRGVLNQGTHFLQKPFTQVALASKVREVLDALPNTFSPPTPT